MPPRCTGLHRQEVFDYCVHVCSRRNPKIGQRALNLEPGCGQRLTHWLWQLLSLILCGIKVIPSGTTRYVLCSLCDGVCSQHMIREQQGHVFCDYGCGFRQHGPRWQTWCPYQAWIGASRTRDCQMWLLYTTLSYVYYISGQHWIPLDLLMPNQLNRHIC